MAWFMRGVQSAVFHYISCAPCHGYSDRKQKRKHAKEARLARLKMQMERPELYHHPEPTGTNPYWQEEITLGPGPPPRRARRTNTGSTRPITTAGTQSSAVSQGNSSMETGRYPDIRLSDGTLDVDDDDDDENWNRKRYQREDEDLWGVEPEVPAQAALSGSSVGVAGLSRSNVSRADSYYSARAPPVNDLHPPIVSVPSPRPTDNRWMLQPPPKASVMSGKERATIRSRSGSGASSRVELSLQRQVSARQLKNKKKREGSPRSMSRGSSYSNLVPSQRHDRPETPQPRPLSAASSHKKRRDTAMTRSDLVERSSVNSSDNLVEHAPSSDSQASSHIKFAGSQPNRRQLSTVMSSGSGNPTSLSTSPSALDPATGKEDIFDKQQSTHLQRPKYNSNLSSDTLSFYANRRGPVASSDRTSLNVLQDLVSPNPLLNTRFASAPLIEARIKLPPCDMDEEENLGADKRNGSGLKSGRVWGPEKLHGDTRVPFDSSETSKASRDPNMRWSVDF